MSVDSTETPVDVFRDFQEPRVTQDWETSPRPDEWPMVQHLAAMAVRAEEQPQVPPQRRPRRQQDLEVLVQTGPNFLDADNNLIPWQIGFDRQKAGTAVLKLYESTEV